MYALRAGLFRRGGRDQPLRGGRRRPRMPRRPVSTAVPGVQRAPGPVWVSRVRNVETVPWVRINLRRYPNGKLLIKPGATAIKRFRDRLAKEFRSLRGSNA